MPKRNSGAKSESKALGRFVAGFDARRGNGPKPGSGGRPRNEFRQRCREIASDDKVLEFWHRFVTAEMPQELVKKDPQLFLRFVEEKRKVWEMLCDRGYGKPVQPIAMPPGEDTGDDLRNMSDQELTDHFASLRRQAATRN